MESLTKWDYAHMEAAHVYAKLSWAERAKVGCVIVKNNRIISIGYNGMPSGWSNICEEDNVTKDEVLHAETNAIAKVAASPESSHGSSLYVTMAPCIDCAKLIYQSGIVEVFYSDKYTKGTEGIDFLNKCHIPTVQIK